MKILLALFFASSLYCTANIPVTYDDIVKLYGEPTGDSSAIHHSHYFGQGANLKDTKFFLNGLNVTISTDMNKCVTAISYERDSAFSEFEINDILSPISGTESWEKKGPSDWILPMSHAAAHWDGANRIVVTSTGK